MDHHQVTTDEIDERQAEKQRKQSRKLELAELAKAEIAKWEAEGSVLVFTDGSAEWVQGVGWVGRWGSSAHRDGKVPPTYPPMLGRPSTEQNSWQPLRFLNTLTCALTDSSYVHSDSSYAHCGVQGNALRWRSNG